MVVIPPREGILIVDRELSGRPIIRCQEGCPTWDEISSAIRRQLAIGKDCEIIQHTETCGHCRTVAAILRHQPSPAYWT